MESGSLCSDLRHSATVTAPHNGVRNLRVAPDKRRSVDLALQVGFAAFLERWFSGRKARNSTFSTSPSHQARFRTFQTSSLGHLRAQSVVTN